MPIFFQQDIDPCTKLAIWKIEEVESFFSAHVPLQREITHPHKRLQHLAGRYLLKHLFPEFPVSLIQIADTRKPYLENEAYHFSISHCADYAAVIVSKENRVGVDIEIVSGKVQRIKHKFVADKEWPVLNGEDDRLHAGDVREQNTRLTTLWSCKEAVFKWYGLGNVDFREHIHIQRMIPANEKRFEIITAFKKTEEIFLMMHSQLFGELCLSYVVT